jgi:hypothetical protein
MDTSLSEISQAGARLDRLRNGSAGSFGRSPGKSLRCDCGHSPFLSAPALLADAISGDDD